MEINSAEFAVGKSDSPTLVLIKGKPSDLENIMGLFSEDYLPLIDYQPRKRRIIIDPTLVDSAEPVKVIIDAIKHSRHIDSSALTINEVSRARTYPNNLSRFYRIKTYSLELASESNSKFSFTTTVKLN